MKYIATRQPIFTQQELDEKDFYEVIGPDTLLFNYQKARSISFKDADKYKTFTNTFITKDGIEVTETLHSAFCGDHYEIHVV